MAIHRYYSRVASVFMAVMLLAPLSVHAAADNFDGRGIILTVPVTIPPAGQRAMLVALHGGGGNATFMQRNLGMDAVAENNGFIVAYLNGTDVARLLPGRMHAWNAGDGCCGKPADDGVDDVTYISNAVAYLSNKYGISPTRIYATGHSNGAMMAQRMLCETYVFQAAVTMSGPLTHVDSTCPAARGKAILAIHGQKDENVPLAGGMGSKGPMKSKQMNYRSEASAKALFEQSGASYTLEVVPNADHALEHLDDVIQRNEGISIAEKIARFLRLEAAN